MTFRPKCGLALLAGAVLVLLSLIAAGCGGSSSPSKAEFIKQADTICEKTDKEQFNTIADVKVSGSRTTPAAQKKLIVEGALPPVRKEADEIAALSPPSGEDQKIEAIVAGIRKGVREVEKDPLGGVETAFVAVGKEAEKYGFKACSEPL